MAVFAKNNNALQDCGALVFASRTHFLVAREVGVEPTTIRLTVERSATELLPNTGRIMPL